MLIHVKLYGDLKVYAPDDSSQFSLTVEPEATLADIHAMLAISGDHHVALVNGRRVDGEMRLAEGDTMVLMPNISGG